VYLRRDAEEIKEKLSSLTTTLLDEGSSAKELVKAGHDMFDLLAPLTGLEDRSIDPSINVYTILESGMAISPRNAGRCAREARRTAMFLRGIEKAIKDLRVKFPGRKINILYAGCGPFALLALPLMSRLAPGSVSFALLEIHRRSLDSAEKIIKGLGFGGFIREYVQCDAATYSYSGEEPLHMVITETMQESLQKETHTAITLNLAPQLCKGGILIPERITVDVCLADRTKERPIYKQGSEILKNDTSDMGRLRLGRLIDFTAKSAVSLSANIMTDESGRNHFPPVEVNIPANADTALDKLMLITNVGVYRGFALEDYDSTITNPVYLDNLGRPQNGSIISFKYMLGRKPGFERKIGRF